MRNKKSQHGFAALEILIVVIILVIVAGSGWYVLHAKQVADKSYKAASNSSSSVSSSILGDTSNYSNKTYGVAFSYPKSWGAPQEEVAQGKVGSMLKLKWNYASAEFQTKDYVAPTNTFSYETRFSENCERKDSESVVWLYFDAKSCAAAAIWVLPASQGSSPDSLILVGKKFSDNAKVQGFLFGMYPHKDLTTDQIAKPKSVYSAQQQQDAVGIAKSLEEIQ